MIRIVLDTNVLLVSIFVDCAIASNANYVVSHDKDFNVLKKIEFPKVKVIDTSTFNEILSTQPPNP